MIGIDQRENGTWPGTTQAEPPPANRIHEGTSVQQRGQHVGFGRPLVPARRPLLNHGKDRKTANQPLDEEAEGENAIPQRPMTGFEMNRLDHLQGQPDQIAETMGGEREYCDDTRRQRLAPLPSKHDAHREERIARIEHGCDNNPCAHIRCEGGDGKQAKPD